MRKAGGESGFKAGIYAIADVLVGVGVRAKSDVRAAKALKGAQDISRAEGASGGSCEHIIIDFEGFFTFSELEGDGIYFFRDIIGVDAELSFLSDEL